jgi:hypothetical protein
MMDGKLWMMNDSSLGSGSLEIDAWKLLLVWRGLD